MADPDNVARVISVVSTGIALASLSVAILSYRRGRPRIVIKEAGVASEHGDWGDVLLVHALVVNRGQAKVQLAAGDQSDMWPLAVEFQHPPAWHERWIGVRRAVRAGMFAPIAKRCENDQIDGFSGLAVSGKLPDETLVKASTDGLTRMRLRITLSTGDMIFSNWMQIPPIDDVLARRLDSVQAMEDLKEAMRRSGVSLGTLMHETLLHAMDIRRVPLRRRDHEWHHIAVLVKQLEEDIDSGRHSLAKPHLDIWRARWAATMEAVIAGGGLGKPE